MRGILRPALAGWCVLCLFATVSARGDAIDEHAAWGALWYLKNENEREAGWMSVRFAVTQEEGQRLLETRSETHMRLPTEAGVLAYTSQDRSLFDDRIRLVSFHAELRVGEDRMGLEGRRSKAGFTVQVRQGESVRELLFDGKDFEATTADEVHRELATPGQEKTLRMLDLESLSVLPVVYRYERDEECPPPRAGSRCQVLYYRKGADVSNAWLARDTGILVRQRGVGPRGSYEILLADEAAVKARALREKPAEAPAR